MSTADANGAGSARVDMKLEVVVLPVADVDRAKQFYATTLGWRLDADFASGDFRVIQVTPPGSQAAVIFGAGITAAEPGSVEDMVLAVEDVAAARDDLAGHGVDVSEVFHDEGGMFVHAGTTGRVPGPDPEGKSYSSWASSRDPDGNGWLMQEITTRLPGRVAQTDVETLAILLRGRPSTTTTSRRRRPRTTGGTGTRPTSARARTATTRRRRRRRPTST